MTHDEHAHPPPGGGPPPTAYAKRGTLTLQGIEPEAALRAAVDAFLSELARSLREQGCKLIGHIKGVFDGGEQGQLFFSVTSFDQKARYKGKLTGSFETIDFALNVIVYGVEREKIEPLVLEGLRRHLGDLSRDSR